MMVNSNLTLHFDSFKLSDEQFFQLCHDNRNLKFERNAYGDVVIMPPTGGETGRRNAKINQQLANWADQYGGICFDSSTGFRFKNGEIRSPDASWIPIAKWNNLSGEEKNKFIPLCPDFIIELRSKYDNLRTLQKKMSDYIINGTKLAWLIDPEEKKVEIYRQDKKKEILEYPKELSGENILPNFILNLDLIWT